MADSIDQSQSRGEIFQARKAGVIDDNRILELGKVIENKKLQRTSDEQITVALPEAGGQRKYDVK